MSIHKTEVPYGVLDLVILQTLAAMGPMHGYSIARRIEQVADNLLTMSQGSIYPALIRLEQKGWIATAVGRVRDQAAGEDLFADDGGRAAAAGRSGELGARDRAGRPVPRGEVMMRTVIRRLLALVKARRLERELEGEVIAHLELAERDAIAAGLSPEEARRAARRSFGSIESMKEIHRDERSVRWIDTFVRDVRYGVLLLLRDRGFAAIAIGVMAIGIGANAAMFSLVDAVLLKPLPYPDPDRIVRVLEDADAVDAQRDHHAQPARLEAPEHLVRGAVGDARLERGADRRRGAVAARMARWSRPTISRCSASTPALGRTFLPKDEEPGAAPGRGPEPRGLAGSLRRRPRHPQSPDHARRRSRTRWSACCRRAASIARPRASGNRCSSRPNSAPATITGSARSAG